MTVSRIQKASPSSGRGGGLFRLAASLKLAVILIVVLAAVLAWATFLEAAKGREIAQWHVYHSPWFIGLLALLGINILAATLIRFPWRRSQVGFLITHAGLLVLLAGSIQTFVSGIEGQLSFVEGEAADKILMADRSQLKVVTEGPKGWRSTEFSFCPGPVDWPTGKLLDFGEADGVRVKLLKFYRRARPEVDWVADAAASGEPAIELVLRDAQGEPLGQTWLPANPFGSRPAGEGPRFEFQQAPLASMRDDFLNPPAEKPEGKGLLSVHYEGEVYPISVEENVGKEVPLGKSGTSVEIVAYYANAVFQGGGRFVSAGGQPKNPMVELKIHLKDQKEPIEEIAYAKNPFVNYALMRGRTCPVKFWYHHAGAPVAPGAEFLETPDGKLYCRVGIEGRREPRGEVNEGERIELGGGVEASILRYLPHARQKVTYDPIELAAGSTAGPEAAVLVELGVGAEKHPVWLARSDQAGRGQRVETLRGPVLLSFGYEQLPLGFSLKLLDFKRGMNPGGMGNASFASQVELTDNEQKIDRQQEISMNSPLVHGKYTFYQSSFRELPDGREASFLSVAYDPGRFLKYFGSVMICGGILLMFLRKVPGRGKNRARGGKRRAAGRNPSEPVQCAS